MNSKLKDKNPSTCKIEDRHFIPVASSLWHGLKLKQYCPKCFEHFQPFDVIVNKVDILVFFPRVNSSESTLAPRGNWRLLTLRLVSACL